MPDEILKFRAPVILDSSGSHKRLPEQVEWEHIQIGDFIMAIAMTDHASGGKILDYLDFWHVIDKPAVDEFEVRIHRVCGYSSGQYVYDRFVEMFASDPEAGG